MEGLTQKQFSDLEDTIYDIIRENNPNIVEMSDRNLVYLSQQAVLGIDEFMEDNNL